MKKRIYITGFCTIIILLLIIIMVTYNKKFTLSYNNNKIKYAISLDGKRINSIPSKGMYKVNVSCDGANGSWSYDDWKLIVSNITGDTTCGLSFTSIEKEYFNDYIVSISGKSSGDGKVINESVVDYTNATSLTENDYINPTFFSSSSYKDISGTEESNIFTYSDNKWSSNSSLLKSNTYYHFMFYPNAPGYYQVCLELGAGDTKNWLMVYNKNIGNYEYISSYSSSTSSACIDLKYLSSNDYIKIIQYTSSTIPVGTFSIKKINADSLSSIRYEGKNPNNYVLFNNELWRVIGVFGSSSHGIENKNLVKIIKDESIGHYVWNLSDNNNWENSSLYNLLNNAYLNSIDGSSENYCYINKYSLSIKGNCNFVKNGIGEKARNMIQSVTWYLGGVISLSYTAEGFYTSERGTSVYSGNPTSVTGFIGLMYTSDYLYSILSSNCSRTKTSDKFDANCIQNSWMQNYYGGTITHSIRNSISISRPVFSITCNNSYSITYSHASNSSDVYPTLYLSSDVFILDGDGSLQNPYIIDM